MLRPRRSTPVESEPPSSHLWVGNLPLDITESDLSTVFSKHGLIDAITCYASRTYAFIYYKRLQDAISAKRALQGFQIKGNSIKIEFAKPAKPSKNVWVGGFSLSVTKEKLEEELGTCGKIEEFKFIRDRNMALVEFVRVEDASAAVTNLNGLQIGEDHIRVDFLRSHPAKRQEQSDFPEMGGAHFRAMRGTDPSWTDPDIMRNLAELNYSGPKRPQPSQSFSGVNSGQPSKVLWVGYPPSVVIDEEMLHNAMILHGEIEKIKCFPARHYSFVEFRSVEEARRAKEGLQGKLFNDPRITIMFSNSGFTPGKDFDPPYPVFRGQAPNMFGTEVPFRPPLMDLFPSNRGIAPNCLPGLLPNGLLGPGGLRPFGPRGSLQPLLPSDFSDQMSDLAMLAPLGLNSRKVPPATGLLPTPGRTSRKTSGWDVLDPIQLPRESKRARIDDPGLLNEQPLIPVKGGDYIAGEQQPYGVDPQVIGGPIAKGLPHGDEDYIWRGVIAKGGTSVCHARCIPMGKGLECPLPEVVNCSARTGLDMLAKHYVGAIGFDIVFFLPDSEKDFANYTEFLRYLGSKNRAGVAKLDDGTTLFLVPPSEFLADVLKVTGRERLYGVVLKLPQQIPGGEFTPQQVRQPVPPIQHMESQMVSHGLDVASDLKNEPTIQMDYVRSAPADPTLPPKPSFPLGSVSQDQSNVSTPSTSQPGVTLTPELIATLSTLLPVNAQTPVGQSAQSHLSSSTSVPSFPGSINEKGIISQGRSQHPQVLDQTMQSSFQFSSQFHPNVHSSTAFQSSVNLNPISHPVPVSENMPIQNPAYNLPEQRSVSSRGLSILPVTQNQQFMPSTQGMQPNQFDSSNNTTMGYGLVHGTHCGSYGVADVQQPNPSANYSNQLLGAIFPPSENVMPSSTASVNVDTLKQAEQLQPVPTGVGQATPEIEVDKNQRYQSTLQFAASLLLQIQQQQQQPRASSHMGNQQ